jgi:hypothetical protein
MKSKIVPFVPPTTMNTTCQEAKALSKPVGARIFWRPGGVVNWMLPELDLAQVLTD